MSSKTGGLLIGTLENFQYLGQELSYTDDSKFQPQNEAAQFLAQILETFSNFIQAAKSKKSKNIDLGRGITTLVHRRRP